VPTVIDIMGEAYPMLRAAQDHIQKVILQEENQFARTIEQGLKILEHTIPLLTSKIIPGDIVFKLYDTYGFPVDLTADIAREHNLELDVTGFEQAMQEQKERARASNQFSVNSEHVENAHSHAPTVFTGYEQLHFETQITDLLQDTAIIANLQAGEAGIIILESTPFYAESGGQVGDAGFIKNGQNIFQVIDTRKVNNRFFHVGQVLRGSFSQHDRVVAEVDGDKRRATALNHSATHLLHAALRKLFGDTLQQKGSLVDSTRLRFDFTYPEALTREQIQQVENLVNEQIRLNTVIHTEVMDIKAALESGAMALFGEKYSEAVRVLKMGQGFSVELCGGTHATRTGDLNFFSIQSESGIAGGVRRIEAITGVAAIQQAQSNAALLNRLENLLKCKASRLEEKIQQGLQHQKTLEKEIQQLQQEAMRNINWQDKIVKIHDIQVVAEVLPGVEVKQLKEIIDMLKNKLQKAVIVLASIDNATVTVVAGTTASESTILPANTLIKIIADMIGGKGGGRMDLAQAGGTNVAGLKKALDFVPIWVAENWKI